MYCAGARQISHVTISVIIPTLNESAHIGALIGRIESAGFTECIVVDGGSRDCTVDIVRARSFARLIESGPGRGPQLNAGAAAATGDTLLFLHADTILPEHAAEDIAAALTEPMVAAGCFRMIFDSTHPLLMLYGWFSRYDCMLTTFGDQAFFMRRAMFDAAGGFPHWPFLEDVEIRQRLLRLGRFIKLKSAVTTSARRYQTEGLIRRQLLNAAIVLLHRCGMPAQRLAPLYRTRGTGAA